MTVAAQNVMKRADQLQTHPVRARENGVKREELIESIIHLTFYSGWPNAMTAINKEVFRQK